MPLVKTKTMFFGTGRDSQKLKISVNVEGKFYALVPELIAQIIGEKEGIFVDGNNKAFSDSLAHLESMLWRAWDESYKPTVTKEHVIHYNIESHISFAETPDGRIVPNCYVDKSAEWLRDGRDKMFGEHNASNNSQGGYSLIVGAKAKTKITTTHGDSSKIEYVTYNGEGDHITPECPASLLNAWTGFSFVNDWRDEVYKEIPYSDNAATFFHGLMLGMAKLSRQIQEATFDQKNLIQLIESKNNLLEFRP